MRWRRWVWGRGKEKGWGKGEKGGVKIGGVEEDIWKWGKDKVEKIRDRVREEREVGRMWMEDLKVKGMEGKDDVGEGVVDGWFGMLVRMVEYKWRWYGVKVIKIEGFGGRWKRWGKWGDMYKGLKVREGRWSCGECGREDEGELNGGWKIKDFGLKGVGREGGKVKGVEWGVVDEGGGVVKRNGRKKEEKRGEYCGER